MTTTTEILTNDLATRYAALRAAVLAAVGPDQLAAIEYDAQQSAVKAVAGYNPGVKASAPLSK